MLSVRNKAIIVDKCLLEELDNNVLLCSVQIGWVLKYDRKIKLERVLTFCQGCIAFKIVSWNTLWNNRRGGI